MLTVLAIRVAGAATTFGLGVFLARVLGSDGYGSYVFATGLAMFLATVGQLGGGTAIIKLRLGSDELGPRGLYGIYSWHILLSLGGVLLCTVIYATFFAQTHAISAITILTTALGTIAILYITNIFQSVKRTNLAIIPQTILVPASVISATWLLDLSRADEVLKVYAISGLLYFLLFATLFVARSGDLPRYAGMDIRWRSWGWLGLTFMTGQLGHSLLFVLLPTSYGFVADPGDMGQFSAAHRLSAASLLAFNAVAVYATPQFADRRVMGDPGQLRTLFRQIVGLSMAISLPILAIVLALPATLTGWIYGAGFDRAAVVLPIIALGVCIHAATGPIGNFLQMNGEARFYNVVSIVMGLAGTGMLMYLGQTSGMVAAAWCLTTTLVIWKSLMILRAIALYRRLTASAGAPERAG